MDVSEILEEAFYYPIKNYKNWLIIAIVFLILGIIRQIGIGQSETIKFVLNIISLLIGIVILGINIHIIHDTVEGSDEIPMIDPVKDFINGIKSLILSIIYIIIPTIITIVIALITGMFSTFNEIVLNASINGTSVVVPSAAATSFLSSILVTFIISMIIFILFALFLEIGQARLAETGSIIEGISIGEISSKISNIGWGKYLIFIILLMLVTFIMALIVGIIGLIPYVGKIISLTIFSSFIYIFTARATGLIYNEG